MYLKAKVARGGGPAAPESPCGGRVHRTNGYSFAVCKDTSPHRDPTAHAVLEALTPAEGMGGDVEMAALGVTPPFSPSPPPPALPEMVADLNFFGLFDTLNTILTVETGLVRTSVMLVVVPNAAHELWPATPYLGAIGET